MKLGRISAAAAGICVALGGGAYADFSAKDAVAVRVTAYRETGAAFKTLNDQLKSDTPLMVLIRPAVKRIVQTSHDQYLWFPQGSGAESGEKTRAKPEIWSDATGFKAAQDRLQQQADLMSKAVDSADFAQMRDQLHVLGQACQACHSTYREKSDE